MNAKLARLLAQLLTIAAWAWVALILFGMGVAMYSLMSEHGAWEGWKLWSRDMSPFNTLPFLVRLVELSPAFLGFFAAGRLRHWAEVREAQARRAPSHSN